MKPVKIATTYQCKFCATECNNIDVGYFNCQNCNMYFFLRDNKVVVQTYGIFSDIYQEIIMNLITNQTSLFVFGKLKPIHINEIYPDILPKDIIKLADRLFNLAAFQ
jgi:hypothetical protein